MPAAPALVCPPRGVCVFGGMSMVRRGLISLAMLALLAGNAAAKPAETPAERDRLNTATGFLAIGVKDVNQRFKNRFIMDNVDEQIDVVTRSVLAATVSCARCHDQSAGRRTHRSSPRP